MSPWLQILLGLAALLIGADLMVRGAVRLALGMGLSKIVVGLTLVAFGTSAPELVVSVRAALDGATDTSLGTVLGSNLANIGLIVGLSAIVSPIVLLGRKITFESNYLLLMSFLTAVPFFVLGAVNRSMGIVLLGLVFLFTAVLLVRERLRRADRPADTAPLPRRPWFALPVDLTLMAAGGIGLVQGGHWLPAGAAAVAEDLSLAPYLIDMVIIGVGTSMPELATSVIAASKGHPEISIGNVIGSNIFNIGMVLGATGTICPLPVDSGMQGPSMVAGIVFAIFLTVLLRSQRGVSRTFGWTLLLAYVGFMAVEAIRLS